jgi:hypothetical protein
MRPLKLPRYTWMACHRRTSLRGWAEAPARCGTAWVGWVLYDPPMTPQPVLFSADANNQLVEDMDSNELTVTMLTADRVLSSHYK